MDVRGGVVIRGGVDISGGLEIRGGVDTRGGDIYATRSDCRLSGG